MNKFLTILFCLVAITSILKSQSLTVFDIDNSQFTTIKAKFFAYDSNQKLIKNLNTLDFNVFEDSKSRKIISVNCPPEKQPLPLSSVLVTDASGSMGGEPNKNIDLAKSSATTWINALDLSKNECAVTSFNGLSFINQDFSNDGQKLINKINTIYPDDGTNYDAAFLSYPSSAIPVAQGGKYNRVIVFLTDGEPNFEPQTASIIDSAKKYQIRIFTITLRMPSPNCLKQISQQTGGEWYEQINSIDEINSTYIKILHQAQNIYEPCEIEWETEPDCDLIEKTTIFNLIKYNIRDTIIYQNPDSSIIKLQVNPFSVTFKNIPPGGVVDTFVTVTAINGDFYISDIKSNNINFLITPKKFSLKAGEKKILTLLYFGVDHGYNSCKFDFINDKCPTSLYVSCINKNKGFIRKSLIVSHPNGGEHFIVGTDNMVKWEGITPEDIVSIDFSPDSGKNWQELVKNVNGLAYSWSDIPHIKSDSCLIRIKQILTQYDINDTGNVEFSLNNSWVNTVSWSHDGTKLAGGSNDRSIRIWDSKTANVIKSLKGHNCYIWSLSWSPDDLKIASGGGDNLVRTWDINSGNIINTLRGHKDSISWVSWSPDGAFIASGCWDGEIIIWDAISGNEINSFFGHAGGVSSIEWEPGGSKLASSGSDNKIKIWDINTGIVIQSLIGHTRNVRSLKWTPDGTNIISGGYDNTLRVWDPNNGNEIKSWNTNNLVPTISISPDGRCIATGGYNELNIWDLNNSNNIKTYSGFNHWVYSVDWNPISNNVACASEDYSVRTIAVNDYELQQDISDSLWSIILPKAKCKEIDMGKVIIGKTKDSLVIDFIENTSNAPFRVDSIYLQKSNTEFYVVNTQLPTNINAMGKKDVTFRFRPNSLGIIRDSFTITNKFENKKYLIFGEGIKEALGLKSDFIDFGLVIIGTEKDTLNALITNLSDSLLFVTRTELLGPDKSQFIIDSGGGNFTLNPNEDRVLKIIFKPNEIGRTSSSIGFFFNGIGSPVITSLYGDGEFRLGLYDEGGPSLLDLTNKKYYLEIRPNPVNDNLMIDFQVPEKENIELFIINFLGERIIILLNGFGKSGTQNETFNIGELGTGIYYVILKTSSFIKSKRLIIIE